jgi:ubiquinone/menaquinone biosynthesis C-methylase UbiE
MQRRLEPEVMDDPEQAVAYAEADFEACNQAFADRCLAALRGLTRGVVVDLGCGPADIPLRLARALPPAVRVVGVDASREMLRLARAAVPRAGRVELVRAYLPGLPFAPRSVDAVVSNSLLHHLPDPHALWTAVRAVARPGAPVVVGDLFRPQSEEAARTIVREAQVSDHPVLERDFYASLLAAFTVDEVRAQLRDAGLAGFTAEVVSERHLLVRGRL